MAQVSFAEIKGEFDETLGYIRQDIKWLLDHNSGLNYTIALLVGCGCEILAGCRGGTKRRGEMVFAELLPSGELQVLVNRLYTALRDGLAHGFDTKHLLVDGTEHQIYLDSRGPQGIAIVNYSRGIGLRIGIRSLAEALCEKITEFETLLRNDEEARKRFQDAHQRTADLSKNEAMAWRAMVKAAGY
jgi:hypothetical protein